MVTVTIILQTLAAVLGCLAALLSILLFRRFHWPAPVLWFLKLYTSGLSPLFILCGVFSTIVGLTTGSGFFCLIGIYNVLIYGIHTFRVTRTPGLSGNFEQAFGLNWEDKIDKKQKTKFLPRRTLLNLPAVPDSHIEQNIVFATIPDTERKLLCDIWQPPLNVPCSGLAFIYLHGSAWYLLDKDVGTRPFFRHLANQGHLIMDVAYRLAPEADLMGMVNDVQRAIFWMKENAVAYNVNPDRIVVGGGSAGGHLALLTAYTTNNPQFAAKELKGENLSIRSVISLYGPTDLEAMYFHTNQHLTTRSIPVKPKRTVPTKMPGWVIKIMGSNYNRLGMNKGFETGTFAALLGGHPEECPETYSLFSPVTHVHSGCPPTLLIHGEHDVMAPVNTTRFLHTQLVEKNVQAVMHVIPQTDHAFDLILPQISPSAHNAIYDVERFLALMI